MVLPEIAARRSVRDFLADDVDEIMINDILAAGQFAPSAMNNHSVGFVVVRDHEARKKLCELAQPRQEFVCKSPVIVIPYIDSAKTPCPIQDLSVSTENIMIQAAAMGLGTVWKNLNEQGIKDVKAFLNIPENFAVINIIPIGYPKTQPKARSQEDFDSGRIRNEKF